MVALIAGAISGLCILCIAILLVRGGSKSFRRTEDLERAVIRAARARRSRMQAAKLARRNRLK